MRVTCPGCGGTGRSENVAYYFGAVECGICQGLGLDPEALDDDEYTEMMSEPPRDIRLPN